MCHDIIMLQHPKYYQKTYVKFVHVIMISSIIQKFSIFNQELIKLIW